MSFITAPFIGMYHMPADSSAEAIRLNSLLRITAFLCAKATACLKEGFVTHIIKNLTAYGTEHVFFRDFKKILEIYSSNTLNIWLYAINGTVTKKYERLHGLVLFEF